MRTIRERVWEWIATIYLVVLPCLYWKGITQDQVQALSLPVISIFLLGISSTMEQRRKLREPLIGTWIMAVILASFRGITPYSYPGIFLTSVWIWIGVFCLTCFAPDAGWISRRIVWLCVANAVFAAVQMFGVDPIFVTHGRPTGFLNRSNLLCVLLLAGIPISKRPVALFLTAVILAMKTVTGWAGLAGLFVFYLLKKIKGKVVRYSILAASPVVASALILLLLRDFHSLWSQNFLYRLRIWKMLITQSAWSPLYGYGNGFWNTVTPYPGDTTTYNQYLAAMHAGGILLLAPLAFSVLRIWKEKPSPERMALFVIAISAFWEDVWNFQRMMVITIALVSCLLIRREEV